ncbi:MAG TPA: hypothetical protein VH022_14435 [Candidatus Acidoferrum sp.]|jgi:hypothetical protein|nr:hypothetical protein [Candidatus Acidoferrum sp.]
MPAGDVYTVLHKNIAVSTAITIIQLKAGANNAIEIIRASLTQRGSTTSAQEDIALIRKSAAATVTAAIDSPGSNTSTLVRRDPNQSAPSATLSTSGTGITASAEGTDTETVLREAFNVLNGWLYLPTPEERIYVPPAGIIGLKFLTAPASQNWDAEVVFMEK